ncbi:MULTISPECIES: hypothetical protein [Streptomyces]|uniref:hypothetical protein n=1 Tax=Streptomyces TaxID=1883 RepID=UPI00117CC6C8|nr:MULTISPECIES: hypothetical protein [Streptomyces]
MIAWLVAASHDFEGTICYGGDASGLVCDGVGFEGETVLWLAPVVIVACAAIRAIARRVVLRAIAADVSGMHLGPTVYRMISPSGPVEAFDLSGRPSPARITARGEALVAMLTRKHMAGPGSAWFEPTSPLVFELDSGDIHVIPLQHIMAVERYEGDEPCKADEQILKITLGSASSLMSVIVFAKLAEQDKWLDLGAKSD